jgi:hypothetical protein
MDKQLKHGSTMRCRRTSDAASKRCRAALLLSLFLLRLSASDAVKLASIGDFGVDDANEADVAAMISGWGATDILALGDLNYWCARRPACTSNPKRRPSSKPPPAG